MIQETFAVGMLQSNCSVFGDEASREAVVIDPGAELERILEVIGRHQLTVKKILLTHAHLDHVGAAQALHLATGAPLAMHPADAGVLGGLAQQAGWVGMQVPVTPVIGEDLAEGELIVVGGLEFRVIHTPGHSPGGVCLHMAAHRLLVAGDTLFRGSIGRTDLPGGSMKQILESIHGKLLRLDPETVVIAGHGEPTTIGYEKRFNDFLQG